MQARSRAVEEGKGKELEHADSIVSEPDPSLVPRLADSSEVEQQATATAASISTERGSLV